MEKTHGEYTLEEYEVAIKSKVPNIYVLFSDTEQNESVIKFKESLHEDVKTYTFKNSEGMNFYIGKILESLLKDNINIEVQENGLFIEGRCIKY